MNWVVIAFVALILFALIVRISAAIYNPATGERWPDKGRLARILLALIDGFPLIFLL